jgi:hypothetical protein
MMSCDVQRQVGVTPVQIWSGSTRKGQVGFFSGWNVNRTFLGIKKERRLSVLT